MNYIEKDPEFENLLIYLRQNRGFDFTGYKYSTLMRRVCKRMQSLNLEDFGSYLDYLEVHPEEFNFLFNIILINVTSFFRDPLAWEAIVGKILPNIIQGKNKTDKIRIWSAGCASGEEAYTIAMLMTEMLGAEEFRHRVKIYATDVDEEALNQGRQATYSAKDIHLVTQVASYSGTRCLRRAKLSRCIHKAIKSPPGRKKGGVYVKRNNCHLCYHG